MIGVGLQVSKRPSSPGPYYLTAVAIVHELLTQSFIFSVLTAGGGMAMVKLFLSLRGKEALLVVVLDVQSPTKQFLLFSLIGRRFLSCGILLRSRCKQFKKMTCRLIYIMRMMVFWRGVRFCFFCLLACVVTATVDDSCCCCSSHPHLFTPTNLIASITDAVRIHVLGPLAKIIVSKLRWL
jgi:hypothetical protein